jgi:hypothetical protein
MRLEGLGTFGGGGITSSGLESAIFWLVAYCLNHYATRVYGKKIWPWLRTHVNENERRVAFWGPQAERLLWTRVSCKCERQKTILLM